MSVPPANISSAPYRGRFAPSPSGPLHFGSLVAALASYLQAKSQNGLWFVRIEDIDKPREQPGAVEEILAALKAFGMSWDIDESTPAGTDAQYQGCVVQSQRIGRYQQVLEELLDHGSVYGCHCSRKMIKAMGGQYQGHCRDKALSFEGAALRIHIPSATTSFCDGVFGETTMSQAMLEEDYIIKRRDGLFAYQLAVVIDDIDQQITEVVRGADILDLTVRQINLFQHLKHQAPKYVHVPLAVTEPGQKLSKQNHATAINIDNPIPELLAALTFLGLNPCHLSTSNSVTEIIDWAVKHWSIDCLPPQLEQQLRT